MVSRQNLIHAAGAVAEKIERDIRKAKVFARRKRHDCAPDDAQALAEPFQLRERLCVFLLA